MTKINCKKYYETTKVYLDLVCSDKFLSSKIKEDKKFLDLIKRLLSLLIFLEKKNKITCKKSSSKEKINFIEVIAGEKKIINENFKTNNETEIIDLLKYFQIYTKNVFNIEIVNKKIINNNKVEEIKNKSIENSMTNLQNEIKSGNIYLFLTKPKIIPILKKLSIVSMCIMSFGALIITFAQFSIRTLTDSDGNTYSLILNGISYLFIPFISFFLIKTILASFSKKKKNNINFYYYFPWQMFSFSLIIILLIFIWDIFDFNGTIFVFLLSQHDNQWKYTIWFIGEILVTMGFLSTIIICTLSAFLNPKEDKEKIKKFKSGEYTHDL